MIRERFGVRVRTAIYKARYNCAPTQNLAVITGSEPETLQFFRWGLIPSWAKEAAIGNKLINARGETISEKPSFRSAFKNRRCLVPATGFFEWSKTGGKRPFNIRLRTGEPFAFAGLWDQWISEDGEIVHSFTIITTVPNELMATIHDRMPVILHRENEQRWLQDNEPQRLQELLLPYPAQEMEAYEVSPLVNTPKNDVAAVLEPGVSGLF